jgi:hypothetical protein
MHIDHTRGGGILEIVVPGPLVEDDVALLLAEMDDERFGSDGLRQFQEWKAMNANKFRNEHEHASNKAAAQASGLREKMKARARANNAAAVAGAMEEKAQFDEQHAGQLALLESMLKTELAGIDADFDAAGQ